MSVDTDLTTLLDWPMGLEDPRGEHAATVKRVEAALSRLRDQRDEYAERLAWHREERDAYMKGNVWVRRAAEERERAEAAEARCAELAEQGRIAAKRYGEYVARCARLQQALDEALLSIEEYAEASGVLVADPEKLRALAGPDTPADSQEDKTCPGEAKCSRPDCRAGGCVMERADSQEDKT